MQSTIHHQIHRQRRLQSHSQSSTTTQLDHRLPQIFSGRLPSTISNINSDTNPNDSTSLPSSPSTTSTEEVDPNPARTASSFLAPQPTPNDKTSYSRLMHAYTKSQMTSPHTGTIPSYTRTMHAFTLAQLNHMEKTSFSAARSSNGNSGSKATSAGKTTREHRTHLQPPSMIALKLPPTQHHPTSSPTSLSAQTLTQTSNPSTSTSTTQTPRPPTNTPYSSTSYEEEDSEALPRAFLPSKNDANSRSTALLAADLRARERELERRFEMLAWNKSGVAAFLGEGEGEIVLVLVLR